MNAALGKRARPEGGRVYHGRCCRWCGRPHATVKAAEKCARKNQRARSGHKGLPEDFKKALEDFDRDTKGE